MTTARTLIEDAYRQDNLIPLDQEILASEFSEGLRRLNAMFATYFDEQVGECLLDWPAPPNVQAPILANYPFYPTPNTERLSPDVWLYPPQNARLLLADSAGYSTIYLYYKPDDGAMVSFVDLGFTGEVTINANGRRIAGAGAITFNPEDLASPKVYHYRADRAEWVPFTEIGLDSESPLPPSFDDMLVCGLSAMLSARRGVQPSPVTEAIYTRGLARLQRRFSTVTPTPPDYDLALRTEHTFFSPGGVS